MMIRIVTDSTSYLPKQLCEQYHIEIVPLSVIFGDESFDETTITNEFFFDKLEQSDALPTSSQVSVHHLSSVFTKYVSEGNAVVGVFLSSKMSGTYQTANLARDLVLKDYPTAQIEIVDSRSNCMQLGYAALAGAKMAMTSDDLSTVVQAVEQNIRRSRFIFTPATLEYLQKGGRIGTASALIGNLVRIKPILTVNNGETDVILKVRTKKRAVQKIMELFLNDVSNYGLAELTVHHINCESEAQELADIIQKELDVTAEIVPIGPVIGTHVGPGAIGLAYYTKMDMR